MIKRIIKIMFIMFIVFFISITSLIMYSIFWWQPPITITLRRSFDTSWVTIESVDEEVFRQLQHKAQSYYKTKDYLYTYGSTGFVYINLKNANTYIVLNEYLDEDNKEFIVSYLTIDRKKLKHYFPDIKFIKKEDLDPEKYKIMVKLENEEIPYPHYDLIAIEDIKK